MPKCTQTLAKRGVTNWPLAELEASAPLLVLTRNHDRGPMFRAFVDVIQQTMAANVSGH